MLTISDIALQRRDHERYRLIPQNRNNQVTVRVIHLSMTLSGSATKLDLTYRVRAVGIGSELERQILLFFKIFFPLSKVLRLYRSSTVLCAED